MNPERIKKLEQIGFSWNLYDDLWMERYQDLVEFYERHGHSLVPRTKDHRQLAQWVVNLRTMKRNQQKGRWHSLSEERLELLARVDFQWDAWEARWMQKYQELADYVRINGKGSIPSMRTNKVLRCWVIQQQKQYKQKLKGETAALNEKRKDLLDELGFPWPSLE